MLSTLSNLAKFRLRRPLFSDHGRFGKLRTMCVAMCFALGISGPAFSATVYSGITFPDGDVSFADRVVNFAVGDAVSNDYADPTNVLGAPDFSFPNNAFALGNPGGSPDNLDNSLFGFVTVEFTDNSLTTSGDNAADLFVFEIGSSGGGVIESFQVEISKDASTWIDLGIVSGDAVVGLDIDTISGVNTGDRFSFVRVTDAPGGATSGNPFGGPDIDAIGAISSAPPVVDPPTGVVPLPAAGWALLSALAILMGFKRRA